MKEQEVIYLLLLLISILFAFCDNQEQAKPTNAVIPRAGTIS
jgi:hypothetical protein